VELPDETKNFWCKLYGVITYADVFTNRQLVTLGAFADAVRKVPSWVTTDGGDGIYAKAVASVLGLCVGKLATFNSTQGRWWCRNGPSKIQPAFSRHALPMVWDFAEANPFAGSVGDWTRQLEASATGLATLPLPSSPARVFQADARTAADGLRASATTIATDPPYFAQIGYADLSDYFYVWLRKALRDVHSDLFRTVATPKADELIAAPYRHGGSKAEATKFFIEGFTEAFHRLLEVSTADLPMLIVYAHRQEETEGDGAVTSTAWEAMLSAVLAGGLRVVRTWPIHATTSGRQIGLRTNALASYMLLVCRPQEHGARPTDRQGFLAALHAELPKAIRRMQEADISTIDLGPAAIGPGMEVFSRFSKVIEPSGKAMNVGQALRVISQVTGEVLDEFVGDLDPETRWAMGWFRDHGFQVGPFDDAEKLFKATATSLDGVQRAGVARGAEGKVRLIPRTDLPDDWDPATDRRPTVWEVTLHLVKRLNTDGTDSAAELLGRCGRWAHQARDLAQWLAAAALTTRPAEAIPFDDLVTNWTELQRRAAELARPRPPSAVQDQLDIGQ
jgi:putative DNA methylase